MAIAVVIGTIIGSGIFKKPQDVADKIPYFGLAALAWVLGGVLALLGSLALAEVAVLYPKAGGNYVYLREGYGRLAAFLWGWVEFWIIRGASVAALATIFCESFHNVLCNDAFRELLGLQPTPEVLTFWQQRAFTVAVLLVLALVNVRGVRWGGGLQVFITVVKVGSLLAIMILPFAAGWLAPTGNPVAEPQTSYLTPFLPESWSIDLLTSFGAALVGVLFAYHGWMNIGPVAEEVSNPNRNLPLAFLGGVGTVIFLYLGANLAYSLILPTSEMAQCTSTPVATLFSLRLLGPIGAAVASAAVMCSTFGAVNGNLMVGPRLLYAMGEDRLAPRALGAIHARYHTPAVAILITAGWSGLLVLAAAALHQGLIPFVPVDTGKPVFDRLTDFAMFGATTFETLAVTTIFVFRRTRPDAERPYRCRGYPWVPALYVTILALVVTNMFWKQTMEALVGVGFIAVGALVYYALLREPASSVPPVGEQPAPPLSQHQKGKKYGPGFWLMAALGLLLHLIAAGIFIYFIITMSESDSPPTLKQLPPIRSTIKENS
jgi:amino acid transporter